MWTKAAKRVTADFTAAVRNGWTPRAVALTVPSLPYRSRTPYFTATVTRTAPYVAGPDLQNTPVPLSVPPSVPCRAARHGLQPRFSTLTDAVALRRG